MQRPLETIPTATSLVAQARRSVGSWRAERFGQGKEPKGSEQRGNNRAHRAGSRVSSAAQMRLAESAPALYALGLLPARRITSPVGGTPLDRRLSRPSLTAQRGESRGQSVLHHEMRCINTTSIQPHQSVRPQRPPLVQTLASPTRRPGHRKSRFPSTCDSPPFILTRRHITPRVTGSPPR